MGESTKFYCDTSSFMESTLDSVLVEVWVFVVAGVTVLCFYVRFSTHTGPPFTQEHERGTRNCQLRRILKKKKNLRGYQLWTSINHVAGGLVRSILLSYFLLRIGVDTFVNLLRWTVVQYKNGLLRDNVLNHRLWRAWYWSYSWVNLAFVPLLS